MKQITTQNLATFYCTFEEDEFAEIINVYYYPETLFKNMSFRVKKFKDGSIAVLPSGALISASTITGLSQMVQNFEEFASQIKTYQNELSTI